MHKIITIDLELPDEDPDRFADVLKVIETPLGYMADNVIVTSKDAD